MEKKLPDQDEKKMTSEGQIQNPCGCPAGGLSPTMDSQKKRHLYWEVESLQMRAAKLQQTNEERCSLCVPPDRKTKKGRYGKTSQHDISLRTRKQDVPLWGPGMQHRTKVFPEGKQRGSQNTEPRMSRALLLHVHNPVCLRESLKFL